MIVSKRVAQSVILCRVTRLGKQRQATRGCLLISFSVDEIANKLLIERFIVLLCQFELYEAFDCSNNAE